MKKKYDRREPEPHILFWTTKVFHLVKVHVKYVGSNFIIIFYLNTNNYIVLSCHKLPKILEF